MSQTKSLAQQWSLHDQHALSRRIFESLHNSDRKKANKLLDSCSGTYEKLIAIDYGMRFIVQYSLNIDIEFILKGTFKNYLEIAKKSVEKLHIGIGIGYSNKLKEYKPIMTAPMVFIYLHNHDQFGIMYHRATKYVDEKPDLAGTDLSIYPFSTKTEEMIQNLVNFNQQDVLDLFEILAENLKNHIPRSVKKHIYEKIDEICKFMPGIKDIPALMRLSLETIEKSSPGDSPISKEPPYKLYATNAISHTPDITKHSLLSYHISKTNSSFKKKKRKANSTDFYSNISTVALSRKKKCQYCKKSEKYSDFTLISCKLHDICINCRTRAYSQGNYSCPECERSYTVREHNLLRVNDNTYPINSKVPKYL